MLFSLDLLKINLHLLHAFHLFFIYGVTFDKTFDVLLKIVYLGCNGKFSLD